MISRGNSTLKIYIIKPEQLMRNILIKLTIDKIRNYLFQRTIKTHKKLTYSLILTNNI